MVATILTNLLTCFYGCNTSEFFDLDPPSPEEYLATPKPVNPEDKFDFLAQIPDEVVEF